MKPDGIFPFHLALQNSAQKHFTHRGHATYIHNIAAPFICRLPYVCETQGSSNTYKLYLIICGDKNKRSFYFFQIGSQIVLFQNTYTSQPVSKICNVTRCWACRVDGRKLRIYKILMLKPFFKIHSLGFCVTKPCKVEAEYQIFFVISRKRLHGNRILLQLFRLSVK